MNPASASKSLRLVWLVAIAVGAPCVWSADARAQTGRQDPSRVAQDPAGRRPPPPDDPNERDVAKRRRFIHELNHQRINLCFQYDDLLKEASNDIPGEKKASVLERWMAMIADDFKPASPEAVRWYANWADYGNPDAAGNVGLTIRGIVGEWVGRGSVIRASQLADSDRYVFFRISFPKRPGLQFNPRPPQSEFRDLDKYFRWDFVPKAEVRKLLLEHFSLPYESDMDLPLHGQVDKCAGVDVFTGRIDRPPPADADPEGVPAAEDKLWAGPAPDRILITDSDPQYVCLSFDLSEPPPEGRKP